MLKKILELTIFFAGMFILLGLGYWQIERGIWKRDILDKLEREYAKDASAYNLQAEDFLLGEAGEFKVVRGSATGLFLPGSTLFWPSISDARYGFLLMDPFILDNGKVLMVNRGWVKRKSGTDLPAALYMPPTDHKVKVTGLVRAVEVNYFTLDNDPTSNFWYRFKPKQIAEQLKVKEVLPMVLYAEQIHGVKYKALGDKAGQRVYPRNKHSQYAFFWFTLAALWIVILAPKVFKKKYV